MKILGIDIGGTSVKLGVVCNGIVTNQANMPMENIASYGEFLKKLAQAAATLAEQAGGVEFVGVGSAGFIDQEEGIVRYSNNVGWTDAPIKADLEKSLGIPVKVANDAHCAALGEAVYGAGRGYERVAVLTVGTGVGGGFVVNGKLCSGGGIYSSAAYIFGHITVVSNGRQCNCGRKGCLEAYASASAVAKRGEEIFGVRKSTKEIFDAARNKDKQAEQIVEEFNNYLGEGAVSIANALRPQVIVIGGGVSASADMIVGVLNKKLEKEVYGFKYAPTLAVTAELGNLAGVIGAAALYFR